MANIVEPIKDLRKISAMKKILRAGNLRNEVIFILGINTALHISDMLALSVGDVTEKHGKIRSELSIKEQKTGEIKTCVLNRASRTALEEYIKTLNGGEISPQSPLFPGVRKRIICREQVWRILSKAGRRVGLEHIGIHTLRKTFGYHVYKRSNGNLALVQKLLNHSSSGDTLRYIGVDKEQMDNAYLDFNL